MGIYCGGYSFQVMPERAFKFLIEGGKATAGPPIGPALTPLGVNVLEIIQELNQKTADFRGMPVTVYVYVDPETKTFKTEVGIPSTVALIAREARVDKGSRTPQKSFQGDLSLESLVKIAKLKMPQLRAKNLKAAVLTVAGTCVSMGITISGKDPKSFIQEVNEGKYDMVLSEATSSFQAAA